MQQRELVKSMKLYEDYFPLSASATTMATASGTEGDGQQYWLQFKKNGKCVIKMTLSLPDCYSCLRTLL